MDAARLLSDLRADGPLPSKEVRADADGAGYSWATIRRAAKALGIEARKEGGAFGGRGAVWKWALPQDAQEPHKMLKPERLSTLCEFEHLVGERDSEPPVCAKDQTADEWRL